MEVCNLTPHSASASGQTKYQKQIARRIRIKKCGSNDVYTRRHYRNNMVDKKFRPYDEIGGFPNLRIYLTPEAQIWYNSEEDYAVRETFVRKVNQLSADIREVGYSRIGKAKAISSAGTTLFYLRLTDAQRILYHYRYEGSSTNRKVIIYILSVSNKTNFQRKLLYSAQQKVHASAWDDFNWDSSIGVEINLEECVRDDIINLERQAVSQFNKLPESDKRRNFSKERFVRECERSTIYEFRIPRREQDGFDFSNKLPEILKLQNEQHRMLNENKKQFLLEGVAGTGKTTILFYRLVSRLRTIFDDGTFGSDKCLFVTHNPRLRDQVRKLLSYFFAKEELEKAKQCIRTVDEEMIRLVNDSSRKFNTENKLTRERFKSILRNRNVDLDLFWEEYRGVLRGYNLHGESRILSKENYIEEIGRRRGQIKMEERDKFYEIALKIEGKLASEPDLDPTKSGWDDLDLCREAYIQIQKNPSLASLDFLFIDEVQDLTTAELEVFLRLINPNGLMDICVAGDLSQSVQPSAFTWQSLRDLIYGVHNIRVDSEYRLDQNFRSTPYLVDAANASLELISSFRNEKVMNLQRPFGGTETRGEPIRLFRENESELINWLKQNNLPNEWCVILVRDEVTKLRLESVLDEGSKEFVETIAKFKGLEERNILLWDPVSGSDRILDLLHHPNRGKEAMARPWNLTTAVIELKYLFVALTRARYLLGIFLPNTSVRNGSKTTIEQHFYSSDFVNKEYYNESNINDLSDFAEADFDEVQQMERGYEFANARQYKMAAATFRNANRIDLYHHYLGLHSADSGEYCDAIMDWSNALDGASTDHAMRNETRELIAKYASSALEDGMTETVSNEIEIAIKVHAADLLGEKATSHLNAKLEERRNNFSSAAELYLEANLIEDFRRCYSKVNKQKHETRAKLMCLSGQYNEAEKLFRLHLKYNSPELAIGIALEPERFEKMFGGPFSKIYHRFEPGDVSWAKEVAQYTGNEDLVSQINEWEIQELLSKENPSESDARRQFKIYLAREQYENCRDVLEHILDETEKTQKALQVEWKEGGFIGVVGYLHENLATDLLDNLDALLEFIPELKKLLENNPRKILNLAIKSNIVKGFDDRKSTSQAAQRLIVISILLEYMNILKDKNGFKLEQFRINLTDLVRRKNQPIIRGCASLLLAHALDEHHPVQTKIEPHRIIIAMIELHHYGLRRTNVNVISWYVAMYALHNQFKSDAKIDDLNTSFNSMHSNKYSESNRRNLLTYCLRLVNGKYNTPSFSRLPKIVTASYEDDIPYLSKMATGDGKLDLPKKRDLSFFPLGIKMSGKLINHVNKDLKWFASIFKTNEIFSKMWDSVFVDGEERGDLEDFMDALPEEMYELEKIPIPPEDDDAEKTNNENEMSDNDHQLVDSSEISNYTSQKDDLGTPQSGEISPSTVPLSLNLDELISNAESEFEIQESEVVGEFESVFYPNLEEEIEGEDNFNGSLTIDRLKSVIDKDAPNTAKERADQLNRLFNQVFTMPWSNAFKFACLLAFKDKRELIEDGVTYIVLSEIDLKLLSKFAANFDIRKDVLNSQKFYSQRILNVN